MEPKVIIEEESCRTLERIIETSSAMSPRALHNSEIESESVTKIGENILQDAEEMRKNWTEIIR